MIRYSGSILLPLLLVLFLAAADFMTGYETSIFPLYYIPVLMATWQRGALWGGILSFLATLLWTWSDYLSGHRFTHTWLLYENGLARLMVLLVSVWAFGFYKKTLERHRERVFQLEQLIRVCPKCGRVAPVAHTEWCQPFELIKDDARLNKYSICPNCERGVK